MLKQKWVKYLLTFCRTLKNTILGRIRNYLLICLGTETLENPVMLLQASFRYEQLDFHKKSIHYLHSASLILSVDWSQWAITIPSSPLLRQPIQHPPTAEQLPLWWTCKETLVKNCLLLLHGVHNFSLNQWFGNRSIFWFVPESS